jgi:ABC-2 type transport system permease protein
MLTFSSMKAYFRNFSALFFTFLIPLVILGIFGLINFGNNTASVNIGIVDQANNQVSRTIISDLKGIKAVRLHTGNLDGEKHELHQGNRDLVAVLPSSIGEGSTAITAYYNQGNPQNSQVAIAIMNQFVDRASFAAAGTTPAFTLTTLPVQSSNLTYVDFLVPGIIAMSIMQTGLFGVVFTFVQWKQRGILRRLMATPMRVRDFFFSQLVARMTTVALQLVILLVVGLLVFRIHFAGNFLYLLIVGILGGAIFLAIGLAISGYAKTEDAAAPIANIISLPLMFLSGVFFARSNMPDWLQSITQYSPLTYVADALRSISIDGASLWAVRTDLIGIFVWLAVAAVLATRLFRWEVV